MPQQHESSNPNPENHNFLIFKQIASGLATTTELIQSLSAEIRDNSVELATIKADLTNVTSDAKSLSKVLTEGNGTAPVLSRISVLETTIKNVEDSRNATEKGLTSLKIVVASLDQKVTQLGNNKKIEAEEKSRRQAIIAIVTGVIALISAIAVAILA